jgi:rRNA maturation endonuclease Nob1
MRDMFRELGRRAEQFKQDMDGAAAEDADYECKGCAARFSVRPEQCPDCGSEEITPTETEERAA